MGGGVGLAPTIFRVGFSDLFWTLAQQTRALQRGLLLDDDLRLLIAFHVAQLNGCAFRHDLNLAQATQKRLGVDRFRELSEYRASGMFSERERAALAFCEEATRHQKVSDKTFETLREHFDETEIVEPTWVNAAENYFNLQAAVLDIGSDELERSSAP